jgi:hypothetical protein
MEITTNPTPAVTPLANAKKPGSGSGGDPIAPPPTDAVTLSPEALALSQSEQVAGSGSGGDPI